MQQLTTDQKREFVENLRKVSVSAGGGILLTSAQVKGDPKFQYCWKNSHATRIEQISTEGWLVVNHKNDKLLEVSELFKKPNGTVQRGDTILCCIPREEATAMQYRSEIEAEEAIEDRKSEVENFATGRGLQVSRN